MPETMEIFKYLPAAKRLKNANCKKCQCTSCMMFALKLSKGNIEIDKCPFAPFELIEMVKKAQKIQQKTVDLGGVIIGGETVIYRHEKTFINKSAIFISADSEDKEKTERILNFEIESIGKKIKIDGVFLKKKDFTLKKMFEEKGFCVIFENDIKNFQEIKNSVVPDIVQNIDFIRHKAIIERDENFSEPIYMKIENEKSLNLCAKAGCAICKCINLLILDDFDEAVLTSLMTLRQNIFTDPEKPLQVESMIYEINNPDENAYVFLTTNFALTYFAVANELSTLKNGSYLVITPSEGMSVLTAWSAEKITTEIATKIIKASDVLDKVKNKRLIIPGLLSDLKDDLQKSLKGWQILIGPVEAYKLPDFVKNL